MIAYIIISGLCIFVFYSFYALFLANEKTYYFNRFYLLFALMMSLTIPVIDISSLLPVMPASPAIIVTDNTFTTIQKINHELVHNTALPPSTSTLLLFVYFTILFLLLSRFVLNILRLISTISKNPGIRYRNSRIVLVDKHLLPFTFLNNIFVNKHDYSSKKIDELLIEHELVHVRQNHSFDIIFIEFVQIFLWINPILILYKKAIKQNHEFLADNSVVEDSNKLPHYQKLLMTIATSKVSSYLGNSFNSSLTKKRLIMINKAKSPTWLSMGKEIMGIIVMVILSTTLVFAQEKPGKKIIVQGSWEYYQDQFTGSKAQSNDNKSVFKDVKMIIANRKDSIKSIKAKQAYLNSADNKWYFENGQVSTYNKFGEGKTETFDNLEVVASAFTPGNKK